MTDVPVYSPDYHKVLMKGYPLRWHSNDRGFGDLMPEDRLWVITSGKSFGRRDQSAGCPVGMRPVVALVENPGDDPNHPAPKYKHRLSSARRRQSVWTSPCKCIT